MRIVQVTRFGGPEVLVPGTAPDPVAEPGQVVVGVAVAPVLFLDTQLRAGWGAEWFPSKPPYVPGAGVAGQVISVGDRVDQAWIGARVVTDTAEPGGYLEQAVASVDALIRVPDALGLPEAAALLHDGRTALGLAEAAEFQSQDWVLVVGAGGGLGLLLVQLAHGAGAKVIAAARGNPKLELARELGADVVVDYSEPGWSDVVREATGGRGVDTVFDGVGGEIGRTAFQITRPGGQFSAHGAPSGHFTAIEPGEAERAGITVRGIEHVQFAPEEGKRLAQRVLQEAAEGRLRPIIGQSLPLERADDAHSAIEARTVIGKTLLVT